MAQQHYLQPKKKKKTYTSKFNAPQVAFQQGIPPIPQTPIVDKQAMKIINKVELAQHSREIRLKIRRTTRSVYNYSFSKQIDRLYLDNFKQFSRKKNQSIREYIIKFTRKNKEESFQFQHHIRKKEEKILTQLEKSSFTFKLIKTWKSNFTAKT